MAEDSIYSCENMSFNYKEWLDSQNLLVDKGLELIRMAGFNAIIVERYNKPNFVRMMIGKRRIDFYIKLVRNRFVKFVWLCKKDDFDPRNNYLIYLEHEERFLTSTGNEINRKFELRDSEHNKQIKYVVVPIDVFRPAKIFLKTMMRRYKSLSQRKMNEFL